MMDAHLSWCGREITFKMIFEHFLCFSGIWTRHLRRREHPLLATRPHHTATLFKEAGIYHLYPGLNTRFEFVFKSLNPQRLLKTFGRWSSVDRILTIMVFATMTHFFSMWIPENLVFSTHSKNRDKYFGAGTSPKKILQ